MGDYIAEYMTLWLRAAAGVVALLIVASCAAGYAIRGYLP
jgi:hypothetical protein